MPTYVPPKANTEFIVYASLKSRADPNEFITNPTIASGDFKVSTDGAAFANMSTLPAVTPAGGDSVKFTFSTGEMNGANVVMIGKDAAGDEWCDIRITIQTSARQVDDLAYPAVSGRSSAIDTSGRQLADVDTIKTNPVVNGGTITFPTGATLASTTNITAGTITTATNVTTVNGLAANVITATSIAADAITDAKVAADVTIASVTGAVGSVTGAVGSVTGNVGGNVSGSVASVTAEVSANITKINSVTIVGDGSGTPFNV